MNKIMKNHFDGMCEDRIEYLKSIGCWIEVTSVMEITSTLKYKNIDVYYTSEQEELFNKAFEWA